MLRSTTLKNLAAVEKGEKPDYARSYDAEKNLRQQLVAQGKLRQSAPIAIPAPPAKKKNHRDSFGFIGSSTSSSSASDSIPKTQSDSLGIISYSASTDDDDSITSTKIFRNY